MTVCHMLESVSAATSQYVWNIPEVKTAVIWLHSNLFVCLYLMQGMLDTRLLHQVAPIVRSKMPTLLSKSVCIHDWLHALPLDASHTPTQLMGEQRLALQHLVRLCKCRCFMYATAVIMLLLLHHTGGY